MCPPQLTQVPRQGRDSEQNPLVVLLGQGECGASTSSAGPIPDWPTPGVAFLVGWVGEMESCRFGDHQAVPFLKEICHSA